MRVFEFVTSNWPTFVAVAAVIGAVSAFVERLAKVRELELKIRQLERDLATTDNRLVEPTPAEIERFGRTRAIARSTLTGVGLLAIGVSIAAATQYAASRDERLIASVFAQHASENRLQQRLAERTNDLREQADRMASIASRFAADDQVASELRSRAGAIEDISRDISRLQVSTSGSLEGGVSDRVEGDVTITGCRREGSAVLCTAAVFTPSSQSVLSLTSARAFDRFGREYIAQVTPPITRRASLRRYEIAFARIPSEVTDLVAIELIYTFEGESRSLLVRNLRIAA